VRAIAKLSRPRLPAIHVVTRLVARLDRARRRPLVWITAPPGAGKTTLMAGYFRARRAPCVWYRVDEGDGDVATFFHYMSLAVKQAVPRARELPTFTPECTAAIGPFARSFFRAVWERLGNRVLVFDNYQDAPQGSVFHDVVLAAASELPEGAGCVVASRGVPPAALARLGAEGAMSTLEPQDLRLTRREAAGLARVRGANLGPKALERLHRGADGWAAGIVLMLAGGQRGLELPAGRVQHELFDYFASEVFDRYPEPTQRVLLETALLPRIPAAAVEELTGVPGARKVLAGMARAGYFTVRLEQREEVYDYHPLFRRFLLQRGEEALSSTRRSLVCAGAARVLSSNGEADGAADLLRAAGAWEDLARLVVAHAPALAGQARLQTLASWIGWLPQELRDREPWLLYWEGQASVLARPTEARGSLERAFQLFMERGDAAGAYLAWSGITYSHLCEWGDLRPLDRWIEVLGELRRRWPEAPAPAIEAGVVGGIFTALTYRQPSHPDMETWRLRARQVVMGDGDVRLRRAVAIALVQFESWRPSYGDARAVVDALAPPPASTRDDPTTAIQWFQARAAVEELPADASAVLRAVEEGVALAEASGLRNWTALLQVPAIWAHLTCDDLDRARAALRAMEASMDRRLTVVEATYETMASFVARRTGDLAQAVQHAERGRKLADVCGGPFWVGLAEAALGAAQLDMGRPDLARDIAAGRYSHPACWGMVTAPMAALVASDALRRGDEDLATTSLRRSFEIAAPGGLLANTLLSRPELAELCAFALERWIEPAHARKVILAHRLEAPDRATAAWPWKFRVTTLGAFAVEKDGEPLRFSHKTPRKPLELLQALVAFGPGDVPEARLTEALWPDADGDSAHHSLESALYRLRKLVPGAVLQRDRKLALDRALCWVDAEEIERLAARGGAAGPPGPRDGPALARQALALYRGPFLSGDERPWALAGRQRARRTVARLVTLVAERLRSRGDERAAGEIERQMARLDPGLEPRRPPNGE
jgi:hypothetical protein